MDNNIYELKSSVLSKLFFQGFLSAYDSYECLFDFSNDGVIVANLENNRAITALAYLNEATSYFVTATAFYYDNMEILASSEIENTLLRFSVYSSTFKENIRDNFSHQTSYNEYQSFIECFEQSAKLLDLDVSRWLELIGK